MKKISKIMYILAIMLVMGILIGNCVYGSIQLPSNMGEIYENPDTTVFNIGGQIIWIAQIICFTAAIIILMFAGVKYMSAAPEGKAEIKKKMIYLAIGAVVLFAAGGIIKIVGNIALNNI